MHQEGFWSGLTPRLKLRLALGLAYFGVAGYVFARAPIAGILLLMAPIFWTVLVIWIGSEEGVSFGPYGRSRDTGFSYLLRHLWRAPLLLRALVVTAFLLLVVGGLGWISTENMRAELAKPTLTERATETAGSATEATKEKVGGWWSTAKGWFGREEAEEK